MGQERAGGARGESAGLALDRSRKSSGGLAGDARRAEAGGAQVWAKRRAVRQRLPSAVGRSVDGPVQLGTVELGRVPAGPALTAPGGIARADQSVPDARPDHTDLITRGRRG
jgi:hypothetical protein